MIGVPEVDARRLLADVMETTFAGDDDVAYHDGPPTAELDKAINVWIGRWDTDTEAHAMRGEHGPTEDDQFVVEVVIDARTTDPSPAGAPAAEDLAGITLRRVREAVRAQRRQAWVKSTVDNLETRFRWLGVTRATSTGPLPLAGAEGWSSTISTDVGFRARQRSNAT